MSDDELDPALVGGGALEDGGITAPSPVPATAAQHAQAATAQQTAQIHTEAIEAAAREAARRSAVRECPKCKMLVRPEDVVWRAGKPHCPAHGIVIEVPARD
jgi:hypothetical protein